VATAANVLPTLDANVSGTRSQQAGGQSGFNTGATDTYQASIQAAWEIDILGANKVLMAAATRREQASQSAWHDARVSVAAEVATAYFNQRFCVMQTALYAVDVSSKAETARLTAIAHQAGFSALGTLTLARASLADAAQQLKAQQAQCDIGVKALVALTNWEESALRLKLTETPFKLNNQAHLFAIAEVPANVIAQRPDIDQAESELVIAMADVKTAQVARLPRVSLSGSIGWQRLTTVGFESNGETWSLGPLTITLPLFDGGKRKADQALAETKYEEQAMVYQSKVRAAVQEVETALVNLHSTQQRVVDLETAIQQYQQALQATEHRYHAGFANLIEVEESRRYALQAQLNQVSLQQSRNNAWISLYRAVGGGWDARKNDMQTMDTQ
jgi:NodT family efflux transporter outer membrane factor (OMF) lipoprotein